jgi:hypothetical protein
MGEPARALGGLLLPAILIIFLGLYVLGLTSGLEPELALLRSGLAGVILAVLGRLGVAVLDSTPAPRSPARRLDRTVGDEGHPGDPLAENRPDVGGAEAAGER